MILGYKTAMLQTRHGIEYTLQGLVGIYCTSTESLVEVKGRPTFSSDLMRLVLCELSGIALFFR